MKHEPLTPDRWATFLAGIREHGDLHRAAKDASPLSRTGALRTFTSRAASDPQARAELEEAREDFKSALRRSARDLALEGFETPLAVGGELVYARKPNPQFTAAYLRAHLEEWKSEPIRVDLSGAPIQAGDEAEVRRVARDGWAFYPEEVRRKVLAQLSIDPEMWTSPTFPEEAAS